MVNQNYGKYKITLSGDELNIDIEFSIEADGRTNYNESNIEIY